MSENVWSEAAKHYESLIERQPEVKSNYWYLGLTLLLQGKEEEAQLTWLTALAEGEPEEIDNWTQELREVLNQEAIKCTNEEDHQIACTIRKYIQELEPDNIDNLIQVVYLAIEANLFNSEDTSLSQLTQLLQAEEEQQFKADLLLSLLEKVLEHHSRHSDTVNFIQSVINKLRKLTDYADKVQQIVFTKAIPLINSSPPQVALPFAELCHTLQPENISVLANLANLCQNTGKYRESVQYAEKMLAYSQDVEDKVAACYLKVRGLMRAVGLWQEAQVTYQQLQVYLNELIQSQKYVAENHLLSFTSTIVFSNYLGDQPQKAHQLRNQVGEFCQQGIRKLYNTQTQVFQSDFTNKTKNSQAKCLKIGYLSSSLRQHSVGWLARWLFKYHNQEKFVIHGYSLGQTNDRIQQFIAHYTTQFNDLSTAENILEIATKIHKDEIDILIDLDSLTSTEVCGVMALKPAPIQITWLGTDASGIPAIDYFIADPYVLPESASEYYAAKIWRLPNTYIAVDGFEIGVPTLRRDELNIPEDAVIYLSAQTGYKRHPHTARLQMKVIKEVPNSYFLIKGLADEESIKKFFTQIAIEEGVEVERLRFLSKVATEEIHRANLGIADIVLDTYPYNGATTTLETLWMGIPLVTRVGEQFAARNSYTMMKNVGVEAGIAWSDEEYVEWGIRLGKDAALRQEVAWQLRKSRQTAPLWNAKQFTREMEKAYQQMWQQYSKTTVM